MSVLTQVFRERGRPLLMPYAVGGYPDLDSCFEILRTYMASGADIVELGIPFSDPLADGPVIQAASQVALRQGVRPAQILELAGRAASEGARIVLLTYLNTILAMGADEFFRRCRDRGVLAVVIPDLPVEESGELENIAEARGVDVILLAAPTSTDARLARIAEAASGFIYCVSTTGVTGARASLRAGLPEFVARIRRHTDLPLAVGFGVSSVEQAATVATYADGVIIGSALVEMIGIEKTPASALQRVGTFLRETGAAIEAAYAEEVGKKAGSA